MPMLAEQSASAAAAAAAAADTNKCCHVEVYDMLPASELEPRLTALSVNAIVLEAPSYTLQDWIPYSESDPAGRVLTAMLLALPI